MSRREMTKCDGPCGKLVQNPYAERGWIHVGGRITRSHGVYGTSSYRTDYIGRDESDFCSLDCFLRALDEAGREAR